MKTLLTLIFTLMLGITAVAQKTESHDKIKPIEMGVVLVGSFSDSVSGPELEETREYKNTVAHLYKFKNSLVKKALAFSAKNDKSLLA